MKFGRTRAGRPHAGRIAAAVGVSPRTVQRWLQGSGDLHVPDARFAELLAAFRPEQRILEEERRARDYAAEALARLNVPPQRRKVEYVWRRDGWLEPHFVSIVRVKRFPSLVRPVVSIDTDKALARLRAAGLVLDTRLMANRFVAQLLKFDVLEAMDGWRIRLDGSQLPKGATETWLERAPRPPLHEFPAAAYKYSKIGNSDS
ncbi:hypothetical protein [Paenarthrobacter nicotinovorans]|uniref:hypothetical protein n=1 Tax=Paenarthrobacter nicotinovorans TaxID=29320 RepID=UPI0011A11DEC|nr:hypothetical protein [Paenarthrobacter nicotinovorans]